MAQSAVWSFSANHLMNSHEASCFSGVLLKAMMFAPYCTVFAFAGSICGRPMMLHVGAGLSFGNEETKNGRPVLDSWTKATLPMPKSVW